MEYNIHQESIWAELGELLGEYVNELDKSSMNPRSYLILTSKLPLNSQKPYYRKKFVENFDKTLDGNCPYDNYQKSNWYRFSWRLKLRIEAGSGRRRIGFLYGDDIRRRLLFGDVPDEGLSMIEEVIMDQFFQMPLENIREGSYIDGLAETLFEPLAAKMITLDRLHRYADNRIRFDLIFDDIRYRLVCSVRQLKKEFFFPELTIFIED